MEELQIDDLTPASAAYVFDRREDVVLQHGGCASRIQFSKATQMNLQEFLQAEVPKLKPVSDELYVLRDITGNNVTLLYGDTVLKYDVTRIEDVPMDELAKALQKDAPKTFYPGIRYPLVGYVEDKSEKHITVYLDAQTIHYKNNRLGGVFTDDITLPPLWLRVDLNKANGVLGCGLAVVMQQEIDAKTTQLLRWPLSNVFSPSCRVCLGTTELEGVHLSEGQNTEGMCVQLTCIRMFSGTWNLDLVDTSYISRALGNLYDTLPKLEKYETAIQEVRRDDTAALMLKLLRVLHEPTGYLRLNYSPAGRPAEAFMLGGD